MITKIKNWVENKLKKIILSVFGIGIVLAAPIAGDSLIRQNEINKLPPHLKLRTEKSKLLGSTTIKGEIKYAYNSGVEIDDKPDDFITSSYKNGNLKEVVDKRNTNSRLFKSDTTKEFVYEIVSGNPIYYKDNNGKWFYADYATTTPDAFKLQTEDTLLEKLSFFVENKAYADTGTFFPQTGTGGSNVTTQGKIENYANTTDWATTHDATSGSSVTDTSCSAMVDKYFSGKWAIQRAFFSFDTSALTDAATISSATLGLRSSGKSTGVADAYAYINIYASTQANANALVAGDFDTLGTTELSTAITLSSWVGDSSTWNTFTLNASGIANINKTGVSKFGAREGHDAVNSAPGLANDTSVGLGNIELTNGSTYGPKLIITYTVSTPTAPAFINFE